MYRSHLLLLSGGSHRGDDSLDDPSFFWGPMPPVVALQPASSFSLAPVEVSSSDLAQVPWALEQAPLPNSGMLALYDSQSKSFSPTRLTTFEIGGVLS